MGRKDEIFPREHGIHHSEINFFDQKALAAAPSGGMGRDTKKRETLLGALGLNVDLKKLKVMECGCGTGWLTSELAGRGAQVVCFDISYQSVRKTREHLMSKGLDGNVQEHVAAVEYLPHPRDSFDMVVGVFILHHLANLEQAAREIYRILKPGGRAVFYETSGGNPLLMFCRRHVVGRLGIPKLGSADEHPLTVDNVKILADVFHGKCRLSYPRFRFFGKFAYQVFRNRHRRLTRWLQAADDYIAGCFPTVRRYSFQVMVELEK